MRRNKNKPVETKLKKMLFDMGVGREDTQTAEHKTTHDNHEFMIIKCTSADDMMSVVNSIEKENLHDDK